MIIRKLVAATLAAATVLSAAPAEAVTRNQFVSRLKQIGVTLTRGNCDGAYGTYNPYSNTMCLNDQLFERGNEQVWDNTITHEAVHVAQDCVNGFHEGTLVAFVNDMNARGLDTTKLKSFVSQKLDPSYIAYIKRIDDPARRDAEYEAYALESSPDLVYDMLSSLCLER